MVETPANVARQLQVLDLIFAHRNEGGLVEQHVRRHQDWVGEDASVVVLLMLLALLFELRHAAELAHHGERREVPAELHVLFHVTLCTTKTKLRSASIPPAR